MEIKLFWKYINTKKGEIGRNRHYNQLFDCTSLSKYLFSVTIGGLASGCPSNPNGIQNFQDMTSTTQTGAVRCCSLDGGSCDSKTPGCSTLTFSEAQQKCSEFGMRLCTEEELASNICCKSGCNFDLKLAWYTKGKLFCWTEFNSTSITFTLLIFFSDSFC